MFRRVDVELATSQPSDRFHHPVQLTLQFLAHRFQHSHVQSEPVPLDLGQHRHQRHLHFLEQPQAALFFQPLFEYRHKLDDDCGCFRHLFEYTGIGLLEQIFWRLGRSTSLVRPQPIAQDLKRHGLQGMATPVRVEHVGGDHRVETRAAKFQTRTGHRQVGRFQIVRCFDERLVAQQLLQRLEDGSALHHSQNRLAI